MSRAPRQRRRPAGLGVVGARRRPGEERRGVVRRVVQGAVLVDEPLERPVEQRARRRRPSGARPVAWCSASSPSARSAWSSSTAGAVPTTPAARGAAQRPVDDVGVEHEAGGDLGGGRPGRGGRGATPASARAATARPFHAVTTLSSRLGCGRCARAASSRARAAAHHARVVGVARAAAGSRRPSSKVPAAVTPSRAAARAPSSAPSDLGELAGRPGVGEALVRVAVDDRVGVERRGEPALVGAQVAQQEVGGLLGHPAGERVAGGCATGGRRRAAAGRCRRASSRSAAPPSRRRRRTARSRRRAGRTSRRAPSPRRCRAPSRGRRPSRCGRGGAAGTPAPSTAGTWARRRSRRGPRRTSARSRRTAVSQTSASTATGAGGPVCSRSRCATVAPDSSTRSRWVAHTSPALVEQGEQLRLGQVGARRRRGRRRG